MTRPLSGVAALAVALPLAACAGGEPNDAPVERPPVNVSVAQLEPGSLTETLELSGEIEPWVAVQVSTELGGRVELVGFREGERVEAGRILARVGTDILEAAAKEAQATLLGAEANFNKTRQLFDRQAVPRQELIAATSRYEAAQAQAEMARLRMERSVVKAPVAGVALTRDVEPGEVMPPGALITTLNQVDRLKAVAGIPESDIAAFRVGGPASVEVDAWPGDRFEGRIHFVAPAAAEVNRTFPVEVALDNRDGRLRPGMIARISLVERRIEDAVVVSRDVLQERDEQTVAVVLEGEVARVRPLVLGSSQGNRVVVLEGLAAGEWLIVKGQRGLVDGQRVAVVERSGS